MGVIRVVNRPWFTDENPPVMENDITGILLLIVLILLYIGQELGLYQEIDED